MALTPALRFSLLLPIILGMSPAAAAADNPWIEPPSQTAEGYPVPQPDVPPQLPAAHGAHPEYAIEWWYWVGHLQEVESGAEFGFQSTVFRLAGDPKDGPVAASPLGEGQLFMSHAALSTIETGGYQSVERLYRKGWQASAAEGRLNLRAGHIEARMLEDERIEMALRLTGDTRLSLTMRPAKPLVAFGQRGLSRKGADPSAVSWYWTYPRLLVSGTLQRAGEAVAVEGIAWMDHEISSSQLGSDLEGWDWTAIQLDDGTEVKAYRLRREDGGMDPWSACYWIDAAGQTERVYAADFDWQTVSRWSSEGTGITYPNEVRIVARHPSRGTEKIYHLKPLFDGQEFRGLRDNNPYWEGACRVLDGEGRPIGRAYLELAGYGGGLGRQLNAGGNDENRDGL
jgi:predicted secreted hydrolase